MTDEIERALARVASGLPEMGWEPAAQLRRRAIRRRRVRLAMVAAAVAVVVLVAGGGLWRARSAVVVNPAATATAPPTTPSRTCAPGATPVHTGVTDLRDVTLNVYNGTSRAGLEATVANELRVRPLTVGTVGRADSDAYPSTILRFGPDTVGGAWFLQAYFPGAVLQFQVTRTGSTVDVILGRQFVNVPTTTEVNQAIARLGGPIAPSGTCPVD